MLAIMRRDFRSYFNSPIAYVLIGLFMLLLGLFLITWLWNIRYYERICSNMNSLLIIPILTMRSMAEDKKNSTGFLLTSPASDRNCIGQVFSFILRIFGYDCRIINLPFNYNGGKT